MMSDKENLFELVERMPTFSQNVVRIIELTSDINSAPKDLVRLVEHDPILTLKVLKLVNSAYFGLSKQVSSIKQGVVYVGVNTIKHLALSIAAIGALPRSNGAGFDMNDFWSHSLVSAAISRLLAQEHGFARGEATSFFIAGLLHDIGQVVFAQFRAAEYREILQRSRQALGHLVELEQQALGMNHAEVGALLAERWQLPAEFVAAIRNHHDGAALEHAPAMDIVVFAANQLAKMQLEESRRLSALEPVPDCVTSWLGMPLAEVPACLPGLSGEIESARAFIEVPMESGS